MGNNEREIEHLEDHLETFDVVWIVCKDEDVKTGLQARLDERNLPLDNVVFRLVEEFAGTDTPL